MSRLSQSCCAVVVASVSLLCAAPIPAAQAEEQFPLRDGDTWVMVGDSITAQHLHSNYFEAYCFTRFPKWTIHFRNSGVSADTLPLALARFDRDAAVWKPTVVSVELGMNDAGEGVPDEVYIQRMGTMAERIRAIGARPVFFAASPVNDGTVATTLLASWYQRNVTLDNYANAMAKLAAQQKAPFADQFHALLDLWGKNKPGEELPRLAAEVKKLAARADAPRADMLKAWLEEWNKSDESKRSIDLMGDIIHPGPPGQLTMCVALLRGLHAPELVSRATLDANGKVVEAMQCQITETKAENGGLSLIRLDDCLSMPIPDEARSALLIMPAIAELSQWMLTVKGLKAGDYELSIDGAPVARFSAEALAKGCNLGSMGKGPVADQGRQVLALVAAKEALVSQFRGKTSALASAPAEQAKATLDSLAQQILEADARIRAAAQPKPRRFVITLVN